MHTPNRSAPGGPGIPARWTSSAKTGVGTALSNKSRVWFTLSHGIFNEIYYPRIDQACVRDMGLIVTDGADFFSEEKRDADSRSAMAGRRRAGIPLVNTCRDGRYRIEKQIVTDPHRDTVLQQVQFHRAARRAVRIITFTSCSRRTWETTAAAIPPGWTNSRARRCCLRSGTATHWRWPAPLRGSKRSVGYVGSSDGWQDLKAHKQMTWEYTRAENGNVALTAEIDLVEIAGKLRPGARFWQRPGRSGPECHRQPSRRF